MSCFLGVDAGTSGIKVIVLDDKGVVRGEGYSECDVLTPYPSWVEQNPLDWWKACDEAVKQAVASCGCADEIAGIGFSGQMQGLCMIDKDLNPIGNCLIWLDQRSGEEVAQIQAMIPEAEMLAHTNNFCFNSFWAPKLMWVRKNRPADFERIYKVMFAKDYLRFRMTGEIAVEVSDASLTLLLDVANRRWSKHMFDRLGLPMEIAPERVLESAEVGGYLRADVAAEWGVKPGIPVVAGAGDQQAGGVGTGIVREGIVGATIGTSGVVFGHCEKPLLDTVNHGIYSMAHAIPDKWCFLGMVMTAGGSLRWLRDTMLPHLKQPGVNVYDHINAMVESAAPGCEGLTYLPYMNGENTPHSDGNARGVFFGLSLRHGMPEICRSVMEGVAFAMRDSLEICHDLNIPVNEVRANGGGAKSPIWRQIQADIYKAELVCMNVDEGPACGGAIMAGVGAGVFKSIPEACSELLKVKSRTQPIMENVKIYDDYYQTFRALYPALKDQFAAQAQIVRKHL